MKSIIELAREAGIDVDTAWGVAETVIERFAALVRAQDEALLRQALECLEDVFGQNKVDVGIITTIKERLGESAK
jgi:hypothetical protein